MFCVLGLLKWDPNGTVNISAGSSAAGYFLGHIRFREPTALYLLPKTDQVFTWLLYFSCKFCVALKLRCRDCSFLKAFVTTDIKQATQYNGSHTGSGRL